MLFQLVSLFSFFSVVLRAGTLVFQSMVLGGLLFGLWTARPSPGISEEPIRRVQTSTWRLFFASALSLAVVQSLYLYVNSAVLMTTAQIKFAQVIGANFFISGCIVLTVALLSAIIAHVNRSAGKSLLPVLALLILGASLLTNHAASRVAGRPLLVGLSCLHELATGFWIGGLPFLVLGLYRAKDAAAQWYITERFSRVAILGVVLLVLSGTTMSLLYVGSWAAMLGTSYGVMLIAKVGMLGVLLLLGGLNFLLIRSNLKEHALPRLRRLIEAEVGIGITVILTAASLTSQAPAIDQVRDTLTLGQIVHRMAPKVPRLRYEYVTEAATLDSAVNRGTVPPVNVVVYNVDGLRLSRRLINYAIESESNHHWMGLAVLAMGLLALAARTGRAPWAQCWPLLLIGIAGFIFLQADSECWPIGWKGFWACWADPESFQHRTAALLCAAFAVFELRVRRRKKENDPLALVFPLMTAIGGAVLLTHSHAIVNVKENALVEWSHVPMGVTAVFAGWARWLELRLPEKNTAIPSWIWPVCFVVIGLMLLNYREM